MLDTDEDRAFYGLIWAGNSLTCLVDKALATRHALPLSWFEVMLWLAQQPEPVTATQLGDATMLSRSRLSRVLEELAGRGLITRQQDPTDGRATMVALSESGRELYVAADATRREIIDPCFIAKLKPEEITLLAQIFLRLREAG